MVPMLDRAGHSRSERLPTQLLDGGNHFDDDPERTIRRATFSPRPPTTLEGKRDSNRYGESKLPRDNLCMKVYDMKNLSRPAENRWS